MPVRKASLLPSRLLPGRRQHDRVQPAPVATAPAGPVPGTIPLPRPRACPVQDAATATAPADPVPVITRLRHPRACRVPVDVAMMNAAPVPQQVRAVPVPPQVQVGRAPALHARALHVPEPRVPLVQAVPGLLRA